ncbi:hypothetical protein MXD62_20085 [Frankia sp. Mgl5]|uniref:hypothetical protein n=1 Tax=Frankia sp. Mgl5 TaxID=2933793 RepID=UPI0020101398|nr:hypothetical protein [Frankia sp. Mgl5]MCK9929451.1 hypothetical protein [Frankia sp. Mgl5]
MPEHTIAVTLAAPTDEALGAVDALTQAALAWAICTTPGATVKVRCDCDQDDPIDRWTWRDLRTALTYALGYGALIVLAIGAVKGTR